ncbi:MAG: hypothetical protein K2F55_02775 [Erysipelotrichaceae bacterium]|nr:hypothetical protein [Erysipelotrichaceae bacterium]
MRQRAGFILFLTGGILLIKPKIDMDQMFNAFEKLINGYWPVGIMCIGIILLAPKKKKKSKNR